MTPFTYAPISLDSLEIRLVTLQPGTYNDPVHISLQHVKLLGSIGRDDDEQLHSQIQSIRQNNPEFPTYEALSYVWGSGEGTKSIVETSQKSIISVTENLDTILRHLRHTMASRTLWIDAICIDQDNMTERNRQVSFMGAIYALANKVVAWLGPEDGDSSYALHLMESLGSKVVVDWAAYQMTPSDLGYDEPHWANRHEILPFQGRETTSLYNLFERAWFGRLWIRQEIVLASDALLQCGPKTIPWTYFRNAVFCIYTKRIAEVYIGDNSARFRQRGLHIFRICDATPGYYTYQRLRLLNDGVSFKDPRDAIYGVRSLLHSSDMALGIRPDYSLNVNELYTKVALQIINRQGDLNFLRTCDLSNKSLPNLPSWVPDWTTSMRLQRWSRNSWSACAWISAQASCSEYNVLRAGGIRIARVDRVRQFDHPGGDFQDQRLWTHDDIINIIKEFGSDLENPDAPYPWGGTFLDAYCRAFCGDDLDHSYHRSNASRPKLEESQDILLSILGFSGSLNDEEDLEDHITFSYVKNVKDMWIGRCFIYTSEGHIGLAPLGTQPGDIVCVIFGCNDPVILRQVPNTQAQWNVVGTGYIQGIMYGSSIYGSPLPEHYQPVRLNKPQNGSAYDLPRFALKDKRQENLITDPAEILIEMGIQPETSQEHSGVVQVSSETLQKTGLHVQDFELV